MASNHPRISTSSSHHSHIDLDAEEEGDLDGRTRDLVNHAPAPHASYGELLTMIRDLQKLLTAKIIDNEKLQNENATLIAENMDKRRRSKKSQASASAIETTYDATQLAKHFAMMFDIWADKVEAFGLQPQVDPNAPERYSTVDSYKLGLTSELMEFLPEECRELVKRHSEWRSLFKHKMGEARSHYHSVLRLHAGAIFAEYAILPEVWWLDNSALRKNHPILQSFLVFPDDKTPLFPPILYPNLQRDGSRLFDSPAVQRIIRIILFGPGSLQSSTVVNLTAGRQWDVTEVSEGIIAYAALMAVFLPSPDTSFTVKGNVTQISYLELFFKFKRMVVLHRQSDSFRALFRRLNRAVFEGVGGIADPDAEVIDISDKHLNEMDEIANALYGTHVSSASPAVEDDDNESLDSLTQISPHRPRIPARLDDGTDDEDPHDVDSHSPHRVERQTPASRPGTLGSPSGAASLPPDVMLSRSNPAPVSHPTAQPEPLQPVPRRVETPEPPQPAALPKGKGKVKGKGRAVHPVQPAQLVQPVEAPQTRRVSNRRNNKS